MGRPPIPVGSYGNISYRNLGSKKVRAMATVHDADGRNRQVTREGTSRQDARTKLQDAIERRPGFTGSTIGPDTTVAIAGRSWLADIDRRVDEGSRAPNTGRVYRSAFGEHVVPGVGELRLREATVPLLDSFILGMRAHHGAGITKTARTVLNGIMGFALRQGAIKTNPMTGVSRVAGNPKSSPRALTSLERETWLRRMEADEVAVRHDLPDLTRMLLATGVRIGECLALSFNEVDVDAKTVEIDYNVVPITGKGLRRMKTKTSAGERTLELPGWAVDVLIRRGDVLGWTGPVFPNVTTRGKQQSRAGGNWRDPSNTGRCFREARDRAGFGWVTTHVFRKTVATMMDEAGLSPREAADQLGHAKVSMTQDVYFGRKSAGGGAAVALNDMFGDSVE